MLEQARYKNTSTCFQEHRAYCSELTLPVVAQRYHYGDKKPTSNTCIFKIAFYSLPLYIVLAEYKNVLNKPQTLIVSVENLQVDSVANLPLV